MKKLLLSAVAIVAIFTANAQWLQQNAGYTNDTLGFYEMSIPNKNTAWAVSFDIKCGLGCGRFIQDFTRTTNGGATWIPGKMGTDKTIEFSNISAIDENEAWVAMNKRFTGGGGLYHTTDGGATWEQPNAGEIFDDNSFPNFVYFKDRNHGIAMGDPNGGYFEVYTTNNKGKKWKRVPQAELPATVPNEYGFASGYAVVNNTLWFGTTQGRMYKTTDFGKTWTVNTVDPAGRYINEIAFNDDMLHGVAHLRGGGGTFLFSTVDGGLTWTNLGQPANWKSSRITAVPGTNALISTGINGNPNFRGSAISYDNGTTWTEIERAGNKTVCRFYDATTGYACGTFVTGPPLRGGIFKSELNIQVPSSGNNADGNRQRIPKSSPVEKVSSIKVYPTPANDVVNIVLDDASANAECTISVISMDGKVIQATKSSRLKTIKLDVSKLVRGVYTLRISTNSQITNNVITITR